MTEGENTNKSIIPLKDIQQIFNPFTSNDSQIESILFSGSYDLEIKGLPTDFDPDISCSSWVLGLESEYEWGWLSAKGKEFNHPHYGTLAVYGYYSLEEPGWTDYKKGIKHLTHREAEELSEEDKRDKNLYYHRKHIGLTTPDGKVLSKWGKGKLGYLIKHPPQIVPDAYGEVIYVGFTTEVKTNEGVKEVFIMPKYNHDESEDYNFELILTDGVKQLGVIRGVLEGRIGKEESIFTATRLENFGTYAYQGETKLELDPLMMRVILYLMEISPTFFGKIEVDELK